jgi:hypothetical protein
VYRVIFLLQASLNKPVGLGMRVNLVNDCIMRRPFQEFG